jgi:hypothetical protein
MTEAEWLACNDARLMIQFIRDRLSDRKARLFACVAAAMASPASARNRRNLRSAIAAAEASVDGADAPGEMERHRRRSWAVTLPDARQSAVETSREFSISHRQAELAGALRCIVGNPFSRPTIPQPTLAWNDRTIPKLARATYEERAYERLPILADALEDAGCSDPDLLGHLRSQGPHVRGCWALDLVLGKE